MPIPITGRPHLRIVGGHRLPDTEGVEPSQEYMTFLATCPNCEEERGIRVRAAGAVEWQRGAMIQDALPELAKDEREGMMTGYCQECWTQLFNGPEMHDFECAEGWGDMCKICGESEAAHEGD